MTEAAINVAFHIAFATKEKLPSFLYEKKIPNFMWLLIVAAVNHLYDNILLFI